MKIKDVLRKIEHLRDIEVTMEEAMSFLNHNRFSEEGSKIHIFLTESTNTNTIGLNPEQSTKIVKECLKLLKQEYKEGLKELKDNNINLEEDNILNKLYRRGE